MVSGGAGGGSRGRPAGGVRAVPEGLASEEREGEAARACARRGPYAALQPGWHRRPAG